jgi:hypothetical protein
MFESGITLEPIGKLTKDLKAATATLSQQEVRYLVDSYYQIQEHRKATGNQCRSMRESEEPHEALKWFENNADSLENEIKKALDNYAKTNHMGQWAMKVIGIGPIIAAGLLSYIDIEKCPTVGHIWSFAGLNPDQKWEKGKLRPWNANLKTLCWKIGESFLKVCNNEKSVYGNLYKVRKEYELAKNEAGEYADYAAHMLESKNYDKKTEAYKAYIQGKLPLGHINSRCKRYAAKIFLSHWHAEAYRHHFNEEPPKPFAISIMGHAHEVMPEV